MLIHYKAKVSLLRVLALAVVGISLTIINIVSGIPRKAYEKVNQYFDLPWANLQEQLLKLWYSFYFVTPVTSRMLNMDITFPVTGI